MQIPGFPLYFLHALTISSLQIGQAREVLAGVAGAGPGRSPFSRDIRDVRSCKSEEGCEADVWELRERLLADGDRALERTSVHQRQLTGFGGPASAAVYKQSFPQPEDALDDIGENEESGGDNDAAGDTRTIEPVDTAQEEPISQESTPSRPGPRPVPNRSEHRSTFDSVVTSPSTATGAQSYFTASESFNDGSFSGLATTRMEDSQRVPGESSTAGAVVAPDELPPWIPPQNKAQRFPQMKIALWLETQAQLHHYSLTSVRQ